MTLACLVPVAMILGVFARNSGLGADLAVLVAGGLAYVVLMSFFVSAVCGYMAGLIGASNSPLSGVGILVVIGAAVAAATRALESRRSRHARRDPDAPSRRERGAPDGNVLPIYRSMGSPRNPTPHQVAQMNAATALPAPEIAHLRAGALSLALEPNTLLLIEVAPGEHVAQATHERLVLHRAIRRCASSNAVSRVSR